MNADLGEIQYVKPSQVSIATYSNSYRPLIRRVLLSVALYHVH